MNVTISSIFDNYVINFIIIILIIFIIGCILSSSGFTSRAVASCQVRPKLSKALAMHFFVI